jgi:hypothetical protein
MVNRKKTSRQNNGQQKKDEQINNGQQKKDEQIKQWSTEKRRADKTMVNRKKTNR